MFVSSSVLNNISRGLLQARDRLLVDAFAIFLIFFARNYVFTLPVFVSADFRNAFWVRELFDNYANLFLFQT